MSNRDPRFRDTRHGDPYQAPTTGQREDPTTGGQDTADEVKAKGQQAKQRADQGMDKAAEGLDQASEKLRQQGGQQGGAMGTAATKTADTLESASSYLRSKDTDDLINDLEALIRRKPAESLLAAAGIGFVLSKIVK